MEGALSAQFSTGIAVSCPRWWTHSRMKANYVIVRRPNGFRVSWICVRRRRIRKKRVRVVETGSRLVCDRSRQDCWHALPVLFDCWEVLGRARLNEETWRSLSTVLSLTLAAPVACRKPLPRLSQNREADVRDWLCDPNALSALLDQLRPYAAEWFLHQNRGPERFAELYPAEGEIGDVYLQHNHGCADGERNSLTARQWEEIVPWLRGLPWEDVPGVVAKVEELRSTKPEIANAVLARTESSSIEGWLDFFLSILEPAKVDEIFQQWLLSRAYELTFAGEWRDVMEFVWEGRAQYRLESMVFVWRSQHEGVDPGRVQAALLLHEYLSEFALPVVGGSGGDCSGLLLKLATQVAPADLPRGYLNRLFRLLGDCSGARGFLESVVDCEGDLQVKTRLVSIALDGESRWDRDGVWEQLRRRITDLMPLIEGLSADVYERIESLLLEVWCDAPGRRPAFDDVLAVLRRLCGNQFRGENMAELLNVFLEIEPDFPILDVLNLPDGSLKRLDEIARSWSRVERVTKGIRYLGRENVSLVLLGLHYRVRQTLQLLETIGGAPEPISKEAVGSVDTHPLFGIELSWCNFAQHLCLLRATLDGTATSVLGRLDDIGRGERSARREALEKLLERTQGMVIEELLRWMEESLRTVWERERSFLGDELQVHTFRLASSLGGNRRSFRRAVSTYLYSGERELRAHVKNRWWLDQHLNLVERGWLSPPAMVIETEEELLYLWVEQRFEEVLKMGTLVNSCLAIGGVFCDSVAANALDVNKHVVMACDERGQFRGRQLVALSEETRLVCFEVYAPTDVSADLKKAFATYDQEFSQQLGVPCQDEGEYTVANLVCREWYDDGSWELTQMPECSPIRKILSDEERPSPVFEIVSGF